MSLQELRVLHITSRADFGGGPEHVYQILQHSPKQWISFVACPLDRPYAERYKNLLGIDHLFIIPHRTFSLKSFWNLRQFIQKNAIDLVHSHGKCAGLYSRLLHLLTNIPCVHTYHGVHMDMYTPIKLVLYKLYEKAMGRVTQRTIVVSPSEQEHVLQKKLVPMDRLSCIPNGVVFPEKIDLEEDHDHFQIISITRFDKQKNAELIVPILHRLKEEQQLHQIQLVLIGDGPGKKALEERLKSEDLSQYVVFTGNVLSVAPYLQKADVYLSTSHQEGMPLGVLEAMSYGLPVVASSVIGNCDAVEHGCTGFLYPDNNAYEASKSLIDLMNSKKMVNQFGQAARERVRKLYSIQQMVASLMLLYDDVVTQRSHPI